MKGIVLDERLLLMTRSDSVATAITDIEAGDSIDRPDGETIVLDQTVPFGHKVALQPIRRGDPVRKYGEVIGLASEPIEAGEWVHIHNVESNRGRGDRKTEGTP